MNGKNKDKRARLANYLVIILDSFPTEILDKKKKTIEMGIKMSLTDANQTARAYGKQSFGLYRSKFPRFSE